MLHLLQSSKVTNTYVQVILFLYTNKVSIDSNNETVFFRAVALLFD